MKRILASILMVAAGALSINLTAFAAVRVPDDGTAARYHRPDYSLGELILLDRLFGGGPIFGYDRLAELIILDSLFRDRPRRPHPPGIPQTMLAQVEDVEITRAQRRSRDTAVVRVVASGNHPDACTQLGRREVQVRANRVDITLHATRPRNVACAQVLTPFQTTMQVIAPIDRTTNQVTVRVNGISASATVQPWGGN